MMAGHPALLKDEYGWTSNSRMRVAGMPYLISAKTYPKLRSAVRVRCADKASWPLGQALKDWPPGRFDHCRHVHYAKLGSKAGAALNSISKTKDAEGDRTVRKRVTPTFKAAQTSLQHLRQLICVLAHEDTRPYLTSGVRVEVRVAATSFSEVKV